MTEFAAGVASLTESLTLNAHLRAHFVHAILAYVDTWSPRLFNRLTMSQILHHMPDQLPHITPIADWSGADVRHRFSVSPVLLSCWVSLSARVQNPEALLGAAEKSLWRAYHDFEHRRLRYGDKSYNDYALPPTAITFAEHARG